MSNSKDLSKRKPSETEIDEVGNPLSSQLLLFCKQYKPQYNPSLFANPTKSGFILQDQNNNTLINYSNISEEAERIYISVKFEELIGNNFDIINYYDHIQITPLIHSIYEGKLFLIDELLKYSEHLDFNHCTRFDKKNALDAAFLQELPEVFIQLINKGAEPSGNFPSVIEEFNKYKKIQYIKENLK